jgi:hypothetical protein
MSRVAVGIGLGFGRRPFTPARLPSHVATYETGPAWWWQDAAGTTPVAADGDPIGRWLNRYGAAAALTQPTAASRPTARLVSGRWYAVFDGVNDFLVCPVQPVVPFSAAALITPLATTANGVPFWVGRDDLGTWEAHYLSTGTDGGLAAVSVVNNAFHSSASPAGVAPDGAEHLLTGVWASATSRQAYADRTAQPADTTNLVPTKNSAYVGKSGVSGGVAFFSGRLRALSLFSAALGAADVAKLAGYLGVP